MLRKLLLAFSLYFFPVLISSCIHCGEKPENYIQTLKEVSFHRSKTLESETMNRYDSEIVDSADINYFALKLDLEMVSRKNLTLEGKGGSSCFACSIPPPSLASKVSDIKISTNQEFEGYEAGADLSELFYIDPISNYLDDYKLYSIADFENEKFRRPVESIYFLYSKALSQAFTGSFRISLKSDGKVYSQTSAIINLRPLLTGF